MAFPFTIKYTTKLEGNISEGDYPGIFSLISDILINKPAKNIIIEGNQLRFKPGNYAWNWNIMVSIEKGIFTLTKQEQGDIITYEFFMYHLLITTFAMGIFFGCISGKLWVGIGAFLWLGGMNWIIGIIRHKGMFDDITEEINNFIAQKNPQPTIQ